MHYLLGLAALVIGAVIATRRTRPTWFVALTGVLVGVGALLAILSYTRVTDGLGIVANNVLGWVFVGLSLITMLSAVFVLERRGERGEELPPLIGDNPFDGDADDSDDLAPGRANPDYTAAPVPRAQYPGAPAVPVAAATDPRADFGDTGAHASAAHSGHPHSDGAVDGTTVVGADPDIATPSASTDVDAAPEGGTDEHGTDRTDRA